MFGTCCEMLQRRHSRWLTHVVKLGNNFIESYGFLECLDIDAFSKQASPFYAKQPRIPEPCKLHRSFVTSRHKNQCKCLVRDNLPFNCFGFRRNDRVVFRGVGRDGQLARGRVHRRPVSELQPLPRFGRGEYHWFCLVLLRRGDGDTAGRLFRGFRTEFASERIKSRSRWARGRGLLGQETLPPGYLSPENK